MKRMFLGFLLLTMFLIASCNSIQQDNLTSLNGCENDSDCLEGYECSCTGIIPACEYCEGGQCVYNCVKKIPVCGDGICSNGEENCDSQTDDQKVAEGCEIYCPKDCQNKTDTCNELLNEESCKLHQHCQPKYGPSCPTCMNTTYLGCFESPNNKWITCDSSFDCHNTNMICDLEHIDLDRDGRTVTPQKAEQIGFNTYNFQCYDNKCRCKGDWVTTD